MLQQEEASIWNAFWQSKLSPAIKSSLLFWLEFLPLPNKLLLSNMTLLLPQVLIQIVDASSVITWDFDVCKGDIVFNIFHSKRAPQPPKKDSLGAHSITSPGGNNVQLIDKVWQLGCDYSMVESPLICKEGESVQVRLLNYCVETDWSSSKTTCSNSQTLLMTEWWFSSGLSACFWLTFQLLFWAACFVEGG